MLGNCEKMVVISSSTSNEWPQPQNQIDEKGLMDHSSTAKMMEKPNQEQHQQQQQQQQQQPPLKCPRCDSSNTKFCYYNNYSLSQPRHFCKACKRYWTRGGTLRNVPVGGGCRKNKRVKRPASSAGEATSSSAQTATSNPSHVVPPGQIDLSSSAAANHINPLFYGLLTNNHHPSEINLPYPARFNSSNGYDHIQPQMDGLGIGFSSGLLASDINGNDYRNGINSISSNKQIQDAVNIPSNSLLSSFSNPIFGSTSTSTTNMASLIASTLQQQKMIFGGGFEGFEDMQMQPARNGEGSLMVKEVKMEECQHRLDWSVTNNQNHIDQINSSSDPSLLWNSPAVGAWLDPSNVGSSVPSLI